MAEQLLLLCDNHFDPVQYPSHTISGQEEATGFEAIHVGNGRRHNADRWSPTTANASRYIQVRDNTLRAADTFIVDRDSNLISNVRAGNTSTVSLSGSDDNFTTTRSLFSISLPSVPGGIPSGALGCVTDEDAWVKTFTADGHYDWRATFAAMGTGITQQIGGLWLGKAWQPTSAVLRLPFEDEVVAVGGAETVAPSGWVGSARPSNVRTGTIHIVPPDENDADQMAHTLGLYARGRPMWVAFRKSDWPWRMMLVQCPKGALAQIRDDRAWFYSRTVEIPFQESQAAYV